MAQMIEQTITPPLQHLELVVQAFHEAAGVSVRKVIRDLIPPVIQRIQEVVKATQATVTHTFLPSADLLLGLRLRRSVLKDRRQLFAQSIGRFQLGRIGEETSQSVLLVRPQVLLVLAEGPQTPFELLVVSFRQFLFESFEFLLPYSIRRVTILYGAYHGNSQ